MTTAELVYARLVELPEVEQREVLHFVGYLASIVADRETAGLQQAQESVLQAIWANPEDEVWDHA